MFTIRGERNPSYGDALSGSVTSVWDVFNALAYSIEFHQGCEEYVVRLYESSSGREVLRTGDFAEYSSVLIMNEVGHAVDGCQSIKLTSH